MAPRRRARRGPESLILYYPLLAPPLASTLKVAGSLVFVIPPPTFSHALYTTKVDAFGPRKLLSAFVSVVYTPL